MSDKSILIKMDKKVVSKVDMAKNIISIVLCFDNTKLSATQITVLAYFMVYGISANTKNLIIKSEICKNISNIKTIMVRLKKLGLIYKDELNGKVYVNKKLSLNCNSNIGIYLDIKY